MSPRPEVAAAQGRKPGRLARVAREPLVHFLLIGVVLFAGLSLVRANQRPVVQVSEQDLAQLVAYWEAQSQRPPTKAELAAMLRERVDEEILAREAQRQGLDKDDIIIRRRLAQKMAFAAEDLAPLPEPDEATLRAFYDRTRDRYAAPVQVSFRHAFFSLDRPGVPAEAAARSAVEGADHGGPPPEGDPFVLPLTYADAGVTDLSRDYGPDFAAALAKAPVGVWSGPVRSGYGWHAVLVQARKAAAEAPFADVRAEVRDAWLQAERQKANAAFMDRLRSRYRIEVAGEN